jgi:replicative DNA helicase
MSGEVGVHDMTSMLTHAVEQIDRAFIDDLPVIESGIPSLDIETGGLAAGEVVLILSPERRLGVETLLKAVLRKLNPIQQCEKSSEERRQVTLWSLRESTVEIGMRFIAAQSGLPFGRLRRGKVCDDEWSELIQAVGMLNELEDFLLIDSAISLQEAKQLINRQHARERFAQRLLFVDSADAALGGTSLREITQLAGEFGEQINAPVVIVHSIMSQMTSPWLEPETMTAIRWFCTYVGILDASRTDATDEFPGIRWIR